MHARALVLGALLGACSGVEPVEPVSSTSGSSLADDSTSTTEGAATEAPMRTDDTAGGADDAGSEGTASGSGSEGSCPVGTEGCPCTARGACDPELQCLSNFCVDTGMGCPIGAEGCPCTQGGGCDPGLECASQVCVDPS